MFQNSYMKRALDLAKLAFECSEIPVGAVVVDKNGVIISEAYNLVEKEQSPTSHAEILALKRASEYLQSKYLNDCDLYVTLEPCPLCAAAISMYRIKRLFYACQDYKFGAVESAGNFFNSKNCLFKPEIYSGINSYEASILMKEFFIKIRSKNKSGE